jgi:hypothetical protein
MTALLALAMIPTILPQTEIMTTTIIITAVIDGHPDTMILLLSILTKSTQ